MIGLYELLTFTEDEFKAAHDEWGCNCGPSALACCLGVGLNDVRAAIPQFDQRRYTSPSMMRDALKRLAVLYNPRPRDEWPERGVVRIQWHGPWTEPGANPRWAHRQTHWIASFRDISTKAVFVFDCNGGMRTLDSWKEVIAPLLMQSVPRCNGKWSTTHRWQVIVQDAST